MQFRIGQHVRMLHDTGEGTITNLIDRHHVEVDWGDDFPMEMHIDEIIAVARAENSYLAEDKPEENQESNPLKSLGSLVYELSLAVTAGDDTYHLHVLNPENTDILFTLYRNINNKYSGIASGMIEPGEFTHIGSMEKSELQKTRAFYFQFINFRLGKGYPHAPTIFELPWSKHHVLSPSKHIYALEADGWIFSLRKAIRDINKENFQTKDLTLKTVDAPTREHRIVDLHIEELTEDHAFLDTREILQIQVEKAGKELSHALVKNYASLVLIHGVGEGVLRSEVLKLLKLSPYVKKVEAADPTKYGNGATIAWFK